MGYQVRVTEENFCIGTTHYPVGSVVKVPGPVMNYMIREGKGELLEGEDEGGLYTRRDMQAAQPRKKATRKKKAARR